jgi:hypothetical protein
VAQVEAAFGHGWSCQTNQATYTISSNAFLMQKWSNLARDDVSRQRLTLPLAFLVGWSSLSPMLHFLTSLL